MPAAMNRISRRRNRCRRRLPSSWAVAALVLGLCASAFSEVTFESEIDRPDGVIVLGDTFELRLVVSGIDDPPPPELPPIPGIKVETLPESRQSFSSISIINGRMTESKTTTVAFRYALTPEHLGAFTIPPAKLEYGGRTYVTQPISVTVVKAIAQDHIIVEVIPSKTELYVDEQFRLTLKIYIDQPGRIRSHQCVIPWIQELRGFITEDFEKFVNSLKKGTKLSVGGVAIPFQRSMATRRGRRYHVYSLGKMFFPASPGEHAIPPCMFKCEYMTRFTERYSLFGERIVKPIESRKIIARSNDVVLHVKPLPEKGRPDYFSGGVGDYKMEASISPSTVSVGDPVTVSVRVFGHGNIAGVGKPKLENERHLVVYEGNTEMYSQREGLRLLGSKKFSMIVEPQSTDVKQIPKVLFCYFDPKAGKYRTLEAGPFPIEVKPAKREVAVIMSPKEPEKAKAATRLLSRDILPIVTSPALCRDQSVRLYRRPWVLWSLPVPFILVLLCALVQRRLVRLRTDVAYARSRQAFRNAKRRLAEARSFASSGAHREFYSTVYRAVTEFIADKLNKPAASITAQSVRDILAGAGADEQTLNELAECLQACEYGQFSPDEKTAEETDKILRDVRSLLKRLGKAIR